MRWMRATHMKPLFLFGVVCDARSQKWSGLCAGKCLLDVPTKDHVRVHMHVLESCGLILHMCI
jgi:hypothetical protein